MVVDWFRWSRSIHHCILRSGFQHCYPVCEIWAHLSNYDSCCCFCFYYRPYRKRISGWIGPIGKWTWWTLANGENCLNSLIVLGSLWIMGHAVDFKKYLILQKCECHVLMCSVKWKESCWSGRLYTLSTTLMSVWRNPYWIVWRLSTISTYLYHRYLASCIYMQVGTI